VLRAEGPLGPLDPGLEDRQRQCRRITMIADHDQHLNSVNHAYVTQAPRARARCPQAASLQISCSNDRTTKRTTIQLVQPVSTLRSLPTFRRPGRAVLPSWQPERAASQRLARAAEALGGFQERGRG